MYYLLYFKDNAFLFLPMMAIVGSTCSPSLIELLIIFIFSGDSKQ